MLDEEGAGFMLLSELREDFEHRARIELRGVVRHAGPEELTGRRRRRRKQVACELVDLLDGPVALAHERHLVVTVELTGDDELDELRERYVLHFFAVPTPAVRRRRAREGLHEGHDVRFGIRQIARRTHAD